MRTARLIDLRAGKKIRELADVACEGWDAVELYYDYMQVNAYTRDEFIHRIKALDKLYSTEYFFKKQTIRDALANIAKFSEVKTNTSSKGSKNDVTGFSSSDSRTGTNETSTTSNNSEQSRQSNRNQSSSNTDATTNAKGNSESHNNVENSGRSEDLQPDINQITNNNSKTTANGSENSETKNSGKTTQSGYNNGETEASSNGSTESKTTNENKATHEGKNNLDSTNQQNVETIISGLPVELSELYFKKLREYENIDIWFLTKVDSLFAHIY